MVELVDDWLPSKMNTELATLIGALVAALAVVALFSVERHRRRYERKLTHLQQIKEVVFDYLISLLRDYYLPILDFKQGILQTTVYSGSFFIL